MSKGQFAVDYYIAIIVFILFAAYILFELAKVLPSFVDEMETQRIRAESYQISELLINDEGSISNWETLSQDDVKRIVFRLGLSDEDRKKTNAVSLEKLQAFESLCASNGGYDFIRSTMKMDYLNYHFSVMVVDRTNGNILVNCFPSENIPSKSIRTDTRRIVSFGQNAYGELILQVW